MLKTLSGLTGATLHAKDGSIGTVKDLLFDDAAWKVRWLVVDTGTWLASRKVLIHPSAVESPVAESREFRADLTKQQIVDSPSILEDQPISQQMEARTYDYYGWDPLWGGSYFGGAPNAIASPLSSPPLFGGTPLHGAEQDSGGAGDPHLRSFSEVEGYRVHAKNGEIGHVEDILVDDVGWGVRYLIIDTKNWWAGKHVLISPYAVEAISWGGGEFKLNVTRDQVRSSPSWNPSTPIGEEYEQSLHSHYGWAGYR